LVVSLPLNHRQELYTPQRGRTVADTHARPFATGC
jgi:hypothetical protein